MSQQINNVRWRWDRGPQSWQEAEEMAADHMRGLGFIEVVTTRGAADGGLDVISPTAAAQVKFHVAPAGAPTVQALIGAALDFPTKIFYATGYTVKAVEVGEQRSVALFEFDKDGVILPANLVALELAEQASKIRGERGPSTIEERAFRCMRWVDQITKHTQAAKTSSWQGRARKQLAKRQEALTCVVQAGDLIAQLGVINLTERQQRKNVRQAESLLHRAAMTLGISLR